MRHVPWPVKQTWMPSSRSVLERLLDHGSDLIDGRRACRTERCQAKPEQSVVLAPSRGNESFSSESACSNGGHRNTGESDPFASCAESSGRTRAKRPLKSLAALEAAAGFAASLDSCALSGADDFSCERVWKFDLRKCTLALEAARTAAAGCARRTDLSTARDRSMAIAERVEVAGS